MVDRLENFLVETKEKRRGERDERYIQSTEEEARYKE